ncbi:MAG: hypothetical protein JWP12_2100 [Bacteroidetes bacterium]|nr:hypothetical protein [Bacteroidota bacterium]
MNYRRLFFLFIFSFTGLCRLSAQVDTARINKLIDKLSWNSISMDCMGGFLVLTHTDSTELELVKIGKPAELKLITALSIPEKTVIAHIILTQISYGDEGTAFLSTGYIYQNCNQLIGWHQFYNGLVWEWSEKNNFTVSAAEISKIQQFWKEKIIDQKDVSIDESALAAKVEEQDRIAYPCNKVYDNNSAGVNYQSLVDLLGKKSDDPAFKNMWNTFGNDSTMHPFNDCFFVNYGPEGLSFRFEKDSLLSTIFVENAYKGELPFGLLWADNKRKVEKKAGKPSKTSQRGNFTFCLYKERSLHLIYDEKNKIKQVSIVKDNAP